MAALRTLVALCAVSAASAAVADLTTETFDAAALRPGRGALVKFMAPWCGHCKALAPDWDRLGEHFAGRADTVLIARVDCTTQAALCERFEVSSYPTIRRLAPDAPAIGETYQGGRSYDDLRAFVEQRVAPACGPAHLDLCDNPEDEKQHRETLALGRAELEMRIKTSDDRVSEAQRTFDRSVEDLQARYDEAERTLAAVKDVQAKLAGPYRAAAAALAADEAARDEL